MDDILDPGPADARTIFLRDVLTGLSQAQKSLPCQYFYDAAGSDLFEQITVLPEYYPTRTEIAILERHADAIRAALGSQVLLYLRKLPCLFYVSKVDNTFSKYILLL